jgi:tyrosyl-tRNA synthetase
LNEISVKIFLLQKRNNDARHVARRLAEEVVRLVHGQAGVDVATEYTNLLYAKDFDCKLLRPDQWNVLATQLPVMQLSFSKTLSKNAIRIVDLAMKTQLYVTRNECEKHVINGGFWVNGQRRSSDVQEMTREQLICDATLPFTLIRKGKRNYLMIKWVD